MHVLLSIYYLLQSVADTAFAGEGFVTVSILSENYTGSYVMVDEGLN